MAKPKLQLRWSDKAEDDLLSLWQYAADEWSVGAADHHLRDIWKACELLLEHPELGRSRDELLQGARSLVCDPHIVFYRTSPTAIQIMRVLHARADVDFVFR